jgi:hypothetical protein
MKKYILIIGACASIFACNNSNENIAENNELSNLTPEQRAIDSLKNEIAMRDSNLAYFVQSVAEIENNLFEIKKKEKMISANSRNGEVDKSKETMIVEDIQAIKELLEKNRNTIAGLNKKFKNASLKIAKLEETIANLERLVTEKEGEIAFLQEELTKANIALSNLFDQYTQRTSELDKATGELNEVYYIAGTKKELEEKQVITREGGFIGIGKNSKMSADANKTAFTKVDLREFNSLNINAKKAKLITSHPSSSYKMVQADGKIQKLEITNVKDFWSNSKYLVVEIKE